MEGTDRIRDSLQSSDGLGSIEEGDFKDELPSKDVDLDKETAPKTKDGTSSLASSMMNINDFTVQPTPVWSP